MTREDAFNLLKPLVDEAYLDGKQGGAYIAGSVEDFTAFYKREGGREPSQESLRIWQQFEAMLRQSYENGCAARTEAIACTQ